MVSRLVKKLNAAHTVDPVPRFETEPGRRLETDWIEHRRERLATLVAALRHGCASFVR